MKDIKLIISDVDDTLLQEKLTEETKAAIKAVTDKGIEFVLCSGRPTINLLKLAEELNNYGAKINYIAGFNGSQIIKVERRQVIKNVSFNQQEVKLITTEMEKLGIDYVLYTADGLATNNIDNKYAQYEAQLNALKLDSLSAGVCASNKILGLAAPNVCKRKMEALKEVFPSYQINTSKPFFIETTKPGINKGLVVTTLSEQLNIHMQNIMVCGDGENDLEMFILPYVYKCAVANGSKKLKKHADKIIESVENNGVAKELMEIIK